jgi:hypothetical protein
MKTWAENETLDMEARSVDVHRTTSSIMGRQNTMSQIEQKVKEGLRIARESVEDPDLLKLCDDLEYTWETLCSNLIIVSVGLTAMKYRSAEQIRAQLEEYLKSIQTAKNQRACLYVPDTNFVH